MNWFAKPTPSTTPDDRERDRKNAEVKSMMDNLISELAQATKELQESSRPERKDYLLSSSMRRGPEK